jgi:hypothetical protein
VPSGSSLPTNEQERCFLERNLGHHSGLLFGEGVRAGDKDETSIGC